MIFKICGLKNRESLICCEENKVDFFGMIFYEKSPRNINLKQAEALTNFSKELKIKTNFYYYSYKWWGCYAKRVYFKK